MIQFSTIEKYLKTWAQYDRKTYSQIMQQAGEVGLLRKRGSEFGKRLLHGKAQQKKAELFYKAIKNQYGTVSQQKAKLNIKYKEFKANLDDETKAWLKKEGIKTKADFQKLITNADKLETYVWDFYPSSEGHEMMLENDGKSESERIKNVIRRLNNLGDFTFGYYEEYQTKENANGIDAKYVNDIFK